MASTASTSKAKVAPAAKAAPTTKAKSNTLPSAPPVIAAPEPSPAAVAAKPLPSAPKAAMVLTMNSHKKYAGLTEAEILKQPEADYMSAEQLAFFHEKLVELRGQLWLVRRNRRTDWFGPIDCASNGDFVD